MKTDQEKIAILVDLLDDREWDYEPDNGLGGYSYCRSCGANNRLTRKGRHELDHKPGCPVASALAFATPLFSVVGLFVRDGKVLAISRKDNHADFGLPGGKIEPTDKTPEDALIRELDEEVGVRVTQMGPIFEHLDRVEMGKRRPCRCYLVTNWEGEPYSKEGAALEWMSPSQLMERSPTFHDYNLVLFKHLGFIV